MGTPTGKKLSYVTERSQGAAQQPLQAGAELGIVKWRWGVGESLAKDQEGRGEGGKGEGGKGEGGRAPAAKGIHPREWSSEQKSLESSSIILLSC